MRILNENVSKNILNKLFEYSQEEEHLLSQKEDQLKRLNDYINSNPTEDDINELNELKASLEKEIQDLKNNSETNYFNENDLMQMLEESRQIVSDLYGADFIQENDTNPSIKFNNIGRTKLGYCHYSISRINNKIDTEINISKVLQKFSRDQLMDTILHEYIHSLRCCVSCGHGGKWKEIADKINSNTDYNLSANADEDQSNLFDEIFDSNHKTVYHVICDNCGHDFKYYTSNANVVKHPERYSHRCPDGKVGKFTIKVENR